MHSIYFGTRAETNPSRGNTSTYEIPAYMSSSLTCVHGRINVMKQMKPLGNPWQEKKASNHLQMHDLGFNRQAHTVQVNTTLI